jgi:hypothetical protein
MRLLPVLSSFCYYSDEEHRDFIAQLRKNRQADLKAFYLLEEGKIKKQKTPSKEKVILELGKLTPIEKEILSILGFDPKELPTKSFKAKGKK